MWAQAVGKKSFQNVRGLSVSRMKNCWMVAVVGIEDLVMVVESQDQSLEVCCIFGLCSSYCRQRQSIVIVHYKLVGISIFDNAVVLGEGFVCPILRV